MTAAMRADVGAYEHLGGETLTMDGTSQALTIPSNASMVQIDAETAPIYYTVNGPIADAGAHGFIPTSGGRTIGPLTVLSQITLFGTGGGGAVAHVQYLRVR
jgi:hypothetical protein